MPRKAKPKDMTFARILTQLMTERKVGVRAMAEACGCSASSITDYRNGVAPTDFKLVSRMANELGVSLAFLLTGKEDSNSNTRSPSVAEVFDDGGPLYDGYARIIVQRLIPREEESSTKRKKRDES